MSAATVSIIVRTMGRPELRRALDALAGQTWADLQIVLVVADPAFDPAPHATRRGVEIVAPGRRLDRPHAANAGLDAAVGSWIGLLDEDDWIEPEHLARLVAALKAPGAPLLAYSDMIGHEADRTVLRSMGYWKRKYADSPIAWPVATLFSRRLVDEFGCRFDPDFVLLEDWDFFVQCAEHTDAVHVPHASAHYDAQAGSSGGGSGINRDDARIKPYIERMTAKWGQRYAELIATSDRAFDAAAAAIAHGAWDTAETVLRTGLAADPGHPLLLNRLALCRRQAGDWAGALQILRRACDSDPGAFAMLGDLAQLEARFGHAGRAQAALGRLRQLATDPAQTARADVIGARVHNALAAPAQA